MKNFSILSHALLPLGEQNGTEHNKSHWKRLLSKILLQHNSLSFPWVLQRRNLPFFLIFMGSPWLPRHTVSPSSSLLCLLIGRVVQVAFIHLSDLASLYLPCRPRPSLCIFLTHFSRYTLRPAREETIMAEREPLQRDQTNSWQGGRNNRNLP